MKVAFIGGGQPRFTPDMLDLFKQLQGVDQADLYLVLWKSIWAEDEQTAKTKLERVLPANWRVGGLKIVDEPEYILPINAPPLDPPQPENISWWYKRCYNQAYSMMLASELLDPKEYDIISKFRGDVSLDRVVNFQSLNVGNKIIIPQNANAGWPDFQFSDLFFLGRPDLMMNFCRLGRVFPYYVELSDPKWYENIHGSWRGEWLSGTFLKHNNIGTAKEEFHVRMNTYGRSRFTDKHYHHQIATDPTEL